MKYDGIIFDIDGTLWDATLAVMESWNETLAAMKIGERVTHDEIKSVMGVPLEGCVERLLPKQKSLHGEIASQMLENDLENRVRKNAFIYDGVKEWIGRLAQNHQIFLVSNCGERYLNIFLDISGIRSQITAFDCYGLSNLPKYQMIINLKDKYGLKKAVYVGDTLSDKEAAEGADVDFVHAAYGFGQKMEDEVAFDDFEKLAEHLDA